MTVFRRTEPRPKPRLPPPHTYTHEVPHSPQTITVKHCFDMVKATVFFTMFVFIYIGMNKMG